MTGFLYTNMCLDVFRDYKVIYTFVRVNDFNEKKQLKGAFVLGVNVH